MNLNVLTAMMLAPALAFSGGAAAKTPAPAAAKRPNIVVIMGDDVGMWNLSAYRRGMMGGSGG